MVLLACIACGSAPAPAARADAGAESAALCEVPTMDRLYPDNYPPDPWGPATLAAPCMTEQHDAIIVLGCPSEADGGPSDCQLKRADIAAGLVLNARNFIVTGGAAHNAFVEADSLAALLQQRGIKPGQIVREPKAMHTDENIYYSSRIMQQRGWTSALVVTEEPGQLVYTALCDANCCVDLGRLTVIEMPDRTKLGHYVLYPVAARVGDLECAQIETPSKFMCTNMDARLACADRFQLH